MVLYDCLIKTQHFAKNNIPCIECELCQMSAGYIIFTGLRLVFLMKPRSMAALPIRVLR